MSVSESIAIIGGGNWGTAVAKKIAQNLLAKNSSEQIVMWIYEEVLNGEKLTDIINNTHENLKYLPNIKLPTNIRASSDLIESVSNKKILFFVIPHQFLRGVLSQIKGKVSPDTICASLMKGIESSPTTYDIKRFSTIIEEELGVSHCAAVMGANVATDVAYDHFAEATVACLNRDNAIQIAELLECDSFRTEITYDVSSVEWCGALKNIYALGAGICDGMGLGSNAKAALLRQSLKEMTEFCKVFDQSGHFKIETMMRSCGVADLIATCFGGRNRRCAAEFYHRSSKRSSSRGAEAGGGEKEQAEGETERGDKEGEQDDKTAATAGLWEEIELELLNGQKLQGVSTCLEVEHFLRKSQYWQRHPDHFPLLRHIHLMITTGQQFDQLFHFHHAVHFTHR